MRHDRHRRRRIRRCEHNRQLDPMWMRCLGCGRSRRAIVREQFARAARKAARLRAQAFDEARLNGVIMATWGAWEAFAPRTARGIKPRAPVHGQA